MIGTRSRLTKNPNVTTNLRSRAPPSRSRTSSTDGLENVRDDRLIGDAAARRIGLLRARLGQPIHRFDRAQDVHVGDAFALGIRAWLDMCSGEDCDNPILNIALQLVLPRRIPRVWSEQGVV